MRSTNYPLSDLFQRQRRYVVPLFQRAYVWGQDEQWEPLWQDILGRAELLLDRSGRDRGSHFLGAIVLNQIKVYGKQVDTVEVIDGQQRLTTIQILLAAFRDLIRPTDERRLGDDLGRLTLNDGVREKDIEQFKVWPTNADRVDFEAAMSAGSVAEIENHYPVVKRKYSRRPEPRPRLIEAYLFFSRAIRSFCWRDDGAGRGDESFSAEHAYALYEALRRHVQMVVIELEDDDDPQVIFETLNARGVELLASDLVRNFVFLRATQQGADTDALYHQLWSEYDERPAEGTSSGSERFWKKEDRQGRAKRTRLDLFIHHYLQYRTAQDLSIGHLYQSFRGWWEREPRKVAEELRELRRHSDVFASILVPQGTGRVDLFARRLRALDTSTVYPLLLMLLTAGQERCSPDELEAIVVDLESYLVRRMVCELTTKNYNRFFLAMLQKLRDEPVISRASVREMLLAPEGPAGEWPDDRKFAQAWMERPLYETLKPARCAMMLEAIDRALWTAKQEAVRYDGALTIEHVMPQQWSPPAWTSPAGEACGDETPSERRYRLLHTMGNLTLLTQALNSSVSNAAFEKKRPAIAEQSLLRLNAHFQRATRWDEDAILERGRGLFEIARSMWPHPGGAA